jgi:D-alanyl-lipoteichoic acid acyltransferase DltB (MBOAT superfamily)
MLFNSLQFFIFLLPVYVLYLILNQRWQNRLLLVASYVFYGSWDWRFLFLIFLSTLMDYYFAIAIDRSQNPVVRKRFLFLSVCASLGILGFFKYFNFFSQQFSSLLNLAGLPVDPVYVNIILPVGISFYTFQTMSYTIDVYRKEMKPTYRFLDFALYVSFFPQLVAGPIERAKSLLPQILRPRQVNLAKFYEGCYLIFWGLFLKAVIADNLAKIVNGVYVITPAYNGMEVLLATYAFTFQIYCDFAGYSHVARGVGKIMGFELMINFNLPYFVTNIQEFWNKWHISLSSWLRDYVYLPLFKWMRGVKGNTRIYLSLMVAMVLIGLWHGASWHFILFGIYYGVLLVCYVVIRTRCQGWIEPKSRWGRGLWFIFRLVFMFHLVAIGMLIFRVEYVFQIRILLQGLVSNFTMTENVIPMAFNLGFFSWLLILVQVMQYRTKDLMCIYKARPVFKTMFYLVCLHYFAIYGVINGNEFIYFQF